ncbi:MAG: InlB B-repeat-containing protein [Clostridia bacterium]|nr:InlB B-repeat-containing protein [Clostridia bacterium]
MKKWKSLLMLFLMILGLEINAASADQFVVTGGVEGVDYTYSGGVLRILSEKPLSVGMTDILTDDYTMTSIIVDPGTEKVANVTFDNLIMGPSDNGGLVQLASGTMILDVEGTNALKGPTSNSDANGCTSPMFSVPAGTKLILQGDGSLTITNRGVGPALGARHYGDITFESGTYHIEQEFSSFGGAAIGSAADKDSVITEQTQGTVTINGGNVTVISGSFSGAAIGGGYNRKSGNLVINGGMLNVDGLLGAGAGDRNGNHSVSGTMLMTGGTLIGSGILCTDATIKDGTATFSRAERLIIDGGSVASTGGVMRLTMNGGKLDVDCTKGTSDSEKRAIGLGAGAYCNQIILNDGEVSVKAYATAVGAEDSEREESGTIQFNGGSLRAESINRAGIGSNYSAHNVKLCINPKASSVVTVKAGASTDTLELLEEVASETTYDKTQLTMERKVWELITTENAVPLYAEVAAAAEPAEGGSVIGSGSYAVGTVATVAATVNNGYEFSGWDVAGVTVGNAMANPIEFTMPNASVSLTANYTPISYAISYDLNGGSLPSGMRNPTVYTIQTDTFTLVNPVREGYVFGGWTGTGLATASTDVAITRGTTGGRSYTATWKNPPHSHPVCGGASCASTDHSAHAESIIYTPWDGTTNLDALGSRNVVLTADVETSISVTGSLNLCLNGFTLSEDNRNTIAVSGGTLNLCDCQGSGKLTSANDSYILDSNALAISGGTVNLYEIHIDDCVNNGAINMTDGSLYMYGGTLSNNTCHHDGGVMYLSDYNDTTNTSAYFYGVNVYCNDNSYDDGYANIRMDGGRLTIDQSNFENNKSSSRGAIALYYDANAWIRYTSISGTETRWGGAVSLLGSDAVLSAESCTIMRNNACDYGGVYVEKGTLNLSGVMNVKDNTYDDVDRDVYLENGALVVLADGSLPSGSNVGICVNGAAGNGSAVPFLERASGDVTEADLAVFFSNQGYEKNIEDGLGVFGRSLFTITFTDTGDAVIDPITAKYGTRPIAPANPTKAGHTFAGWMPEFPEVMPAEDLTLTALWTVNRHTVRFDANGGVGTMEPQVFVGGVEQALTTNVFARSGYIFVGWNLAADGSSTFYEDGTTGVMTADVTLYAQWAKKDVIMPNPQYTIELPAMLRVVEEEAFAQSGAQAFTVGSNCSGIESRAFAGCENLVLITLPASVSAIADNAFEGCNGFVIAAPAGSYAIDYAQYMGYDYIELE